MVILVALWLGGTLTLCRVNQSTIKSVHLRKHSLIRDIRDQEISEMDLVHLKFVRVSDTFGLLKV